MEDLVLFKLLQRGDLRKTTTKYNIYLRRYLARSSFASTRLAQPTAGFTLIELIAVVVMVGILSAIAAPGWLAFTNRQRVNKVNDVVLSALQEAQRQAKKKKLDYSVSFTTDNTDKIAKIAIHPGGSDPKDYWRNLGGDLEIKSTQVVLGTNITAENTAITSVSYAATYDKTKPQTITFNYMGNLPTNAELMKPKTGSTDDAIGLKIVVAVPKAGNPTEAGNVKRCVIVKTLLGSIITEKDDNCEKSKVL